MSREVQRPRISVIILNYNGKLWLARCLESLRSQTFFRQTEVIIADNASQDGSDRLAAELLEGWPRGRFVQNGSNLGFCEGNNRGAAEAQGDFLFFLNNDTWLEPDCLEVLVREMERTQAGAGGALVLDYDSQTFQSIGGTGFDWLGFPNAAGPLRDTSELFATCGCAYVIRADLFRRLGGFDKEFFLYSDETDLSWRVWATGSRVVGIPSARVHHRGAAAVNPAGGTRVTEFRTSTMKRYYANRNGVLLVWKNAQHLLLFLMLPHLAYLLLEAAVSLLILRQWSFVREGYLRALRDAWRMRHHVRACRQAIRGFRRQGDLAMLRFVRLKPSRWEEVRRLFQKGVPKIDS